MNTTNQKLRDKITSRLKKMSKDKLKFIDDLLDRIDDDKDSRKKILSFAGAWSDLDDETFRDLTDKLHGNRKKGRDRINGV